MSEAEVIDATPVEEEPAAELVPAAAAGNLFHTDEPTEVLTKATEVANALAPVIRERGMVSQVQGKDHVNVEGWQTLGAMLGVTPVITETQKVDNGWEATVEARTLDGRVIGRAESMCLKDESRWASADEYAIRSMAQTRATSRALASVLRFVVTLAGFSGTPAEEMRGGESSGGGNPDRPASEKQRSWVLGKGKKEGLIQKAGLTADQLAAVEEWAQVDGKLTSSAASTLIEHLKDGTEEGKAKLLEIVGAPISGTADFPPDTSDFDPVPAPDHAENPDADPDDIPF